MTRAAYPNDLTDAEWDVLFPLLPQASSVGRPRKWSLREILDGIFYVLRGGIAWRATAARPPPLADDLSLSPSMATAGRLGGTSYGPSGVGPSA